MVYSHCMPAMIIIDFAALGGTVVTASSLAMMLIWSGVKKITNRMFALYAVSIAAGGIFSILLRISLILSDNNAGLFLELATFCLFLSGPLILLSTARYAGFKHRWPDILALGSLLLLAVLSPFLFTHRLVADPRMLASGVTTFEVARGGYPAAIAPALTMIIPSIIFRVQGILSKKPLIPLSMIIVLAGVVLKGVFMIPFPLMSVTNALGIGILGLELARRELFNPLRELTVRLEKKVAERTQELQEARSSIARVVEERTARLIQEVSERRKAEESLKGRVDRLELIAQVGRKTTALLGLDELLQQAVVLIRDVFEYLTTDVFLMEGKRLVLRASTNIFLSQRKGEVSLEVGREGIVGWVAAKGEPLIVPDVEKDPRYINLGENIGTRSEIAVPLRLKNAVIGVLDAQSARQAAFTHLDLFTLLTVADQLAVAMENSRLYDALNAELAEREHGAQILRESEEQFRNLAEQSPNIIFINKQGKIVYANKQAEMIGYSREEIYGPVFDFVDITAPEYRELIVEKFRGHMKGKEAPPYEYAFYTRDGRRVDAILTTKLVTYAGERAIMGIVTDITPRKRMERLLRALNAAALSMEQVLDVEEIFPIAARELESLGLACAVAFADEKKTRLTLHFSNVKQLEQEGDLPLSIDGSISAVKTAMRELTTTLIRPGIDTPLAMKAFGVIAPWRAINPESRAPVILSPLRAEDDVLGLLSVSGESLSEKDLDLISAFAHQMAAAWRKTSLMRDLSRSLDELQRTQDLLLHAQKMEAIGRLAGGIAHDFNNVLTVISGFTSLLLESQAANPRAVSDLQEIRNAVKRGSALTSRLLAFSRRQILQPKVLDLNAVLSGCAGLLRPIIGEDIGLSITPAGGLGLIKADPYQIEQVIINLAVNARDAMPSGGTLTLETADESLPEENAAALSIPPGHYAVLRVRDTGVGMSDEIRQHMFEPFFTTKTDGKGTGLGLSTVYGIIKQTGGAIEVSSEPGAGAVFTIHLPVVAEEERDEQPASEGVQTAARGSGTIVVVEDDASVREMTGRILENGGYTVLAAESAEKALDLLAGGRHVDLVITDMVMPGMNGMELSLAVQQMRPELPVLFISGYTDDPGIRLGVPDGLPFLLKPFHTNELLNKVAELLGIKP
jgi:PAS domain S-box-containing protein